MRKALALLAATVTVAFLLTLGQNIVSSRGKPKLPPLTRDERFSQAVPDSLAVGIPVDFQTGRGMRLFDQDGEFHAFDQFVVPSEDHTISFFLSIVNGEPALKDDLRLLVLVDDEIRPFYVDGSTTATKQFDLQLRPRTVLDIPITIDLNDAKGSANRTISLLVIRRPSIDQKNIGDMYYAQLMKVKTRPGASAETRSVPPLTAGIRVLEATEERIGMELTPLNVAAVTPGTIAAVAHTAYQFRLSMQDEPGRHMPLIMLDDEPLEIGDGKHALHWEQIDGERYEYDFLLKSPPSPGQYSLYAITVHDVDAQRVAPDSLVPETTLRRYLDVSK
jgi:hypothetical protein